jgi:predicted ATPase
MPADPNHPEVQAYFAEANAPTIIGTSGAMETLKETLNTAGLVLEQLGRSRRLLAFARLSESSPNFYQKSEDLKQALDAAVRDTEDVQRILMNLARHIAVINQANADSQAVAAELGYVFP